MASPLSASYDIMRNDLRRNEIIVWLYSAINPKYCNMKNQNNQQPTIKWQQQWAYPGNTAWRKRLPETHLARKLSQLQLRPGRTALVAAAAAAAAAACSGGSAHKPKSGENHAARRHGLCGGGGWRRRRHQRQHRRRRGGGGRSSAMA